MNQERLDEIKRNWIKTELGAGSEFHVIEELVEYVDELEQKVYDLEDEITCLQDTIEELEEQE